MYTCQRPASSRNGFIRLKAAARYLETKEIKKGYSINMYRVEVAHPIH
jgi:hypothetical protein